MNAKRIKTANSDSDNFSENGLKHIIENNADGIIVLDQNCIIIFTNPAAEEVFGRTKKELRGSEFGFPIIESGTFEINVIHRNATIRFAEMRVVSTYWDGDKAYIVSLRDITERKKMQEQIMQSQKMEAIGQLAAGIAHEINTPTQFIRHNIRFIQDGVKDIASLVKMYVQLAHAINQNQNLQRLISDIQELSDSIDPSYLLEEIPNAIGECIGGIETITSIINAMKGFSHPGTKEKDNIDINKALLSTITVSKNEWKHYADLNTDFVSDLPYIKGYPVELGQAFLNIIINAAHTINEKIDAGLVDKGKIFIQTRQKSTSIEIRISDNGFGIPSQIQSQIFNPFFTTKDVGKGTGQGLSIAHSVIVNKHGGTIDVESIEGEGTTFIVTLPIDE